jgi:hypothetical protein
MSTPPPAAQPSPESYRFQLLRCRPIPVSSEHYNIAVVLLSDDGRVVDARFSPDLSRLRCHPAVEMQLLEMLRDEFEERRLLGEGFTEYFQDLARNLSNTLDLSEELALDSADPLAEMDRLVETYVAPRGLAEPADESQRAPAPGSRRAVRLDLERALDAQSLFLNGRGVQREVTHAYGPGKLVFTFDFGYQPADGSGERALHALGARDEASEAARICFVFGRMRDRLRALTVVTHEGLADETRGLLESSDIEPVLVAAAPELAQRIRGDLGL